MNIVISTTLDDESGNNFLNIVKQALGEICGASSIACHEAGSTTFIYCCLPDEPQVMDIPLGTLGTSEIPTLSTQDIPSMSTSDIPAIAPVELPPMEVPPMDNPSPFVSTSVPGAELPPDATMSTELPVTDDKVSQGNHVVVSLNSTVEIPAFYNSAVPQTTLFVMTDVVTEGAVIFWYAGMEFVLPAASPNEMGIANPTHQLSPCTVRLLITCCDSGETVPYYVDVVRGEVEELVFGLDVASAE